MSTKVWKNAEIQQFTLLALGEHAPSIAEPKYEDVRAGLEKLLPGVFAIQIGEKKQDPLLEAVAAADLRHDALLKSTYDVLDAFTQVVDPDRSVAIAAVRDRLFPGGVAMINRTYSEEGAEAELAPRRLHPGGRALLRSLPLPGDRSVDDLVEEYLASCREILRLDNLRLARKTEPAASPQTHLMVRNAFGRIITALRSVVALSGKPNRLVDVFEEMDARAETRARQRAGTAVSSHPLEHRRACS